MVICLTIRRGILLMSSSFPSTPNHSWYVLIVSSLYMSWNSEKGSIISVMSELQNPCVNIYILGFTITHPWLGSLYAYKLANLCMHLIQILALLLLHDLRNSIGFYWCYGHRRGCYWILWQNYSDLPLFLVTLYHCFYIKIELDLIKCCFPGASALLFL